MSATRLVPEEGQSHQGAARGSVLGSPLVESCRQLSPAFYFRRDVQNYVDGHFEVYASEVFVDAKQAEIVTVNLIEATGKIVDVDTD